MQVLIVDDNAMVRRGVRMLLSCFSTCTVCGEAGSGDEAVAKAQQLRPDLILLDISMPGSNGFEVAARVRHDNPATKIVMMSQHDPARLLPRALEAGADACVDKDSLSTELLPTILRLAGSSNAPGAANGH